MLKVRNLIGTYGKEIENQFVIYNDNITVFQSGVSTIIEIDRDKKIIKVFPMYNYGDVVLYRNLFMRTQGFYDMATINGFNYYYNLGAIGDYEIIDGN